MPIYAYRCESCGFQKDALQKMSDAPLKTCPECGKDTFAKQVTAAGFQLKGSGWYVTDFRGGNNGAPAAAKKDEGAKAETKSEGASDSSNSGKESPKSDSSTASAPASDSSKSSASSTPAASKPAAPASN
ncbi:MAG: zinc ribbon domain-containing protein [Pseudomonadota bacterium]|uniref:Type I antifreeze protein n=1 Tax=Caballeronia sordidicola TaxID=196367 RepID=A0A242M6L6_CABSO|nr:MULTISPECIES: zinc ribbon domain-containing protein [Burkholderiaceae]AMM12904.1 FmdB family transcriptional regulator [Burkholderia sp. PAMC 28687]MDP9156073.1 zinc ribbon domain-containing protein [Pseudomonadota bacterium]OTP66473.1 Type I antifreeze protein [Caballeronia sordidicola]